MPGYLVDLLPSTLRYNHLGAECAYPFLDSKPMPDLTTALQGQDLGYLKIVAAAWGIELNAPDAATALPLLVRDMRDGALVNEVLEALSPDVLEGLQALFEREGSMSWAEFCRRFGELRRMGPARRDRERPDLNPTSVTEVLWYRGLIARATFNVSPEPQDHAYIPDELIALMPQLGAPEVIRLGRPASPGECAHPIPATDRILDHACTLLAALRLNLGAEELEASGWGMPVEALKALLQAAELIDRHGEPDPEAVRSFLEAPRAEALAQLAQAWMKSYTFNDLRMLPGLKFEGKWQNQPYETRQAVLEMLSQVPGDSCWSIGAFVAAVKERRPDFQRPAGDYDSWFIRKEGSESYLSGIAAWDEVDGPLLRWIVSGPMHWLGLFDLAAPAPGAAPTAFRPSAWSASLWHGNPPQGLASESAPVRVMSGGRLLAPLLAARPVRYQLARFCRWEGESKDGYHYRLTPGSLERAMQQGLRPAHLIGLLKRYAAAPIPPDLFTALERWEKFGAQAKLEQAALLRVKSPEVLEALKKTRAAKFLGETLNPTTIVVKAGGEKAVRDALAECGYLPEEGEREGENRRDTKGAKGNKEKK